MSTSEPEITKKLAEYIAAGTYEDIPGDIVTIIKISLLDGLATAFAGAGEPVNKILDFIKEMGGTPVSTIIGSGYRTSSVNAALANGALIHALDYDDGLQLFSFHCTSVLLPTILALGEARGISGKEAIAAFAFGMEGAAALFRSANRNDYDLGWHRTGTGGTIAATGAASKILGLDAYQTQMALGMGASQVSGIRQNFGTMTKPLHSGLAARNGVTAALLAEKGFTSDAQSLEGKLGLCNVLFRTENYEPERILESLNRPFDYMPAIRIKKYPACGQNTRPIDAMLALVREYDIQAEQVASIDCGLNPTVMNTLFHSHPTTGLEAKFSVEFCLAAALVDRAVGLDHFTDEKVNSPVIQDIIARVNRFADPSVPHSGGKGPTVTVHMKDGRVFSKRMDMPPGHSWTPASREEQIAKYRDCARRVLPQEKTERCLDLMENLELLQDIRPILDNVSA